MEIVNKTLALVLWAKNQNNEDDVAVFPGKLIQKNGAYFLERADQSNPEILPEWLHRIKEVPDHLKETLQNCELQLSLTVGDLGENTDPFKSYGLKWPT